VPVLKGYYTWDDYRDEYFLDEEGNPPTEENEEGEEEPLEFTHDDKVEALGFDPDRTEELLGRAGRRGRPRGTGRRAHGRRESGDRRGRVLLDGGGAHHPREPIRPGEGGADAEKLTSGRSSGTG